MTKIFCIILSFLCTSLKTQLGYASDIPVDWSTEETVRAVNTLASVVCDNGLSFQDISNWDELSFQGEGGKEAAMRLLDAGMVIGNFDSIHSYEGNPSIFSLLGLALVEGSILEKNMSDAAKFLVWGHKTETKVGAGPGVALAHSFLGSRGIVIDSDTPIDVAIETLKSRLAADSDLGSA